MKARLGIACFISVLVVAFAATPVSAIGSFDASDITVKHNKIEFTIANLDRTNDGDHGGYDGVVNYSSVFCADTNTYIAIAPDEQGPWNKGDKVKYKPINYDGSPHTDCRIFIYTNGGLNDYASRESFDLAGE